MANPADTVFGVQFSVYVSGIYLPASSVSVTTAFSAIPQCTIALPPYAELYGIGRQDRVPVHVFFLDNFREAETPAYKLFFEGVITGFGYVNNAIGRSFVIQCESVLNILNKIYIRHLASMSDVFTNALPGQSLTEFTKMVIPSIFPMLLFSNDSTTLIKDRATTEGDNLIMYPTQMLENALNFIVNYDQDNPLAKFYKEYLTLIKATKRSTKVAYFDTKGGDFWGCKRFPTLSFLTDKATVEAIATQVNEWGQRSSIYELISGVLAKMEYEFAFFNSPALIGDSVVSMCLKPILYDAMPPACNVMFRSLISSISTNENVDSIPTRIRSNDVNSIINIIAGGNASELQQMATLDCYPSEGFGPTAPPGVDMDEYTQELLISEQYTGPNIADISAPDWWSYVSSAKMTGTAEEQKTMFYTARMQMMKNMFLKKRYEGSRLSVTMAFNPYIVAGLPGVAFDPKDDGFTFIGQVLAVQHDIHKGSATTTVELGYVRSLEEESTDRLLNTLTLISEKVTNYDVSEAEPISRMSEVYGSMIACDAVANVGEIECMLDDSKPEWAERQMNPKKAYDYNKRDVVSQTYFMQDFLGLTENSAVEISDDYGNKIPSCYDGGLVDNRNRTSAGYHPDYRERLLAIQSTEVDQTIYGE